MPFKRVASLAVAAAVLMPLSAMAAPKQEAVLKTYADIAHATYGDSLKTAKDLKAAVAALVANPDETTLAKARSAWIAARVPYQQTEAFRFGNPIVDDWEGKVNAWPLDEGLIDYVDASYGASDENPLAKANVIANKTLTIGGKTVDASQITKELLAETLHEAGGVEANVATGYHAIEFLLWGQDLNGTGPGAGNRKATDFSRTACTNGNCDRRAEYLTAATDLLIDDLEEMVKAWDEKGEARDSILKDKDNGLARILTGLGSLSYGELAGERMKLGVMLHDPEEEHDCFSDNTHNSHYYDQIGMANVYGGTYKRVDGSVVKGASLSEFVAARDAALDAKVQAAFKKTTEALAAVKQAADSGKMAYDQMLAADNAEGNRLLTAAIDSLVAQKGALEEVVAKLGLSIEIEGSDSLDNPSAVK